MALYRTQADLLRGDFYVLESPCAKEPLFLLGPLLSKNEAKNQDFGRFVAYDKSGEALCGEPLASLSRKEFLELLDECSEPTLDQNLKLGDFEGYEQTFRGLQKNFKETDLQKAVLYSTVHAGVDFVQLERFKSLLRRGLQNKTDGYLYGFYSLENKSALLGCSPEYIYKKEAGVLKTTAVAGTKALSDDSPWSSKLLSEHKAVMEEISESLGDKVKWSEPFEFKFSSMKHLKAEGLIEPSVSSDLISQLLHPTAAVGTKPKEYFDKIKLGDLERSFFGGYAEITKVAEPFSIVTIRCMEWSSEAMQVCIGGGVLPESLVEDEWMELQLKWKSFKNLWGLS